MDPKEREETKLTNPGVGREGGFSCIQRESASLDLRKIDTSRTNLIYSRMGISRNIHKDAICMVYVLDLAGMVTMSI